MSGTGPGGKTIEEARDRVKKDMKRIGMERLHDEIMGNEASFFMLRT